MAERSPGESGPGSQTPEEDSVLRDGVWGCVVWGVVVGGGQVSLLPDLNEHLALSRCHGAPASALRPLVSSQDGDRTGWTKIHP